MDRPRGMLGIEDLEREIETGEIDTVVVSFTDHYGRNLGKRFDARHFVDDALEHGTHACDYLLAVDVEMKPVPGYEYASWGLGYGDFHMVPDLATLRVATWLDRTAFVLCDLRDSQTDELVAVAPRSVLRGQLESAAESGYVAKAASELEYFLFQDSYRQAAETNYQGLTPAGWYSEDYHLLQGTREEFFNGQVRRHLAASGIPVENSKGEWGRGQHEMTIRYGEILEMADRHTIMKQAMKEIADGLGASVTFMAKPSTEEAGSSCHLHVSLWAGDENAFPGEHENGPVHGSDIFRWFLGGWMTHAPDLMVLMAPTVNSYKRYQDESFAPTRLAWSYDNRTAGFRVVGHEQSLRIECRIPGADVNPYLVYASALAAGIDGINNRIEPPAILEGDVYQAEDAPEVPRTLRDALERFEGSEFVRDAFGAEVQAHYSHFFRTEQSAYDNAVTDWERARYFERI
ncbi:MAG: glutamine synthetase family protein [Acidimicrobiia bacterium]|nr:MAG: glutamine synthetase family protein [Acidimicrobiia bacterium]